MPEQEIDKNVWVLSASPKVLESSLSREGYGVSGRKGKHDLDQ